MDGGGLGAMIQGIGDVMAGEAQAQQAEYNAMLMRMNATQQYAAGSQDMQDEAIKGSHALGELRAKAAASGAGGGATLAALAGDIASRSKLNTNRKLSARQQEGDNMKLKAAALDAQAAAARQAGMMKALGNAFKGMGKMGGRGRGEEEPYKEENFEGGKWEPPAQTPYGPGGWKDNTFKVADSVKTAPTSTTVADITKQPTGPADTTYADPNKLTTPYEAASYNPDADEKGYSFALGAPQEETSPAFTSYFPGGGGIAMARNSPQSLFGAGNTDGSGWMAGVGPAQGGGDTQFSDGYNSNYFDPSPSYADTSGYGDNSYYQNAYYDNGYYYGGADYDFGGSFGGGGFF